MALTITPGGADDDSFAALAAADQYAVSVGYTAWTDGADNLKENALRRGTAWIDGMYGRRWPGVRTNGRDQALGWPRYGAKDQDGFEISSSVIPREVERATIEAAFRELSVPDSLTPDYVRATQVKREKVGPIEREYHGDGSTGDVTDLLPVLTIVEHILKPLIGGGSSDMTAKVQRG
ncbi:MAG: DnaT-like ssDNA-binding protein [Pseudomonadota bacterium]